VTPGDPLAIACLRQHRRVGERTDRGTGSRDKRPGRTTAPGLYRSTGAKMLEGLILALFILMVFSLAWQSLTLRQKVEALTVHIDAIEEQRSKHEQAERRRRDYEIAFLESKASALQRRVDTLHARLDVIDKPNKNDSEVRAAVDAFMTSFRA
jgi:hypothetical protein